MATNNDLFTPLGRIARGLVDRTPQSEKATFVRPNNTLAYDQGDAIYPQDPGDGSQIRSLQFPDMVPVKGGSSLVLSASLIDFAAQATRLEAVLWLFDEPLATPPVDNETFAPTAEDMDHWICTITFPSSIVQTAGNHSTYEPTPNQVVKTTAGSKTLHGYLVVSNAYTPVENERFTLSLGTLPKDLAIF